MDDPLWTPIENVLLVAGTAAAELVVGARPQAGVHPHALCDPSADACTSL
jgi:hypothetical protein